MDAWNSQFRCELYDQLSIVAHRVRGYAFMRASRWDAIELCARASHIQNSLHSFHRRKYLRSRTLSPASLHLALGRWYTLVVGCADSIFTIHKWFGCCSFPDVTSLNNIWNYCNLPYFFIIIAVRGVPVQRISLALYVSVSVVRKEHTVTVHNAHMAKRKIGRIIRASAVEREKLLPIKQSKIRKQLTRSRKSVFGVSSETAARIGIRDLHSTWRS